MRCPECAAEIADETQVCVSCGAPTAQQPLVAAGPAASGPGDSLETAPAMALSAGSPHWWEGEAGFRVAAGVVAAAGALLIIWACALPIPGWTTSPGGLPVSIFNGLGAWAAAEPVGVAILAICAAVLLVAAGRVVSQRWLASGILLAFGTQTSLLFAGYGSNVGMLGGLMLVAAGALGVVSSRGHQAAPAATASTRQVSAGPFVPGPDVEVPAGLRRVLRCYAGMAVAAFIAGVALVYVGFFYAPPDAKWRWWNGWSSIAIIFTGIGLVVWTVILVVERLRFAGLLRRPADATTATVTTRKPVSRTLALDAPSDGYLPELKILAAWWTGREMPQVGESVTVYGRTGGKGPWLVSGSEPTWAMMGTGERQPTPSSAKPAQHADAGPL